MKPDSSLARFQELYACEPISRIVREHTALESIPCLNKVLVLKIKEEEFLLFDANLELEQK